MVKSPAIRIQKSRSGEYLQLVLVYFNKEDVKRQQYFSIPYREMMAYMNNSSNKLFLVAPVMFSKDSAQYKHYIKEKNIYKESIKRTIRNAPITTRIPITK